MRDITYIKTVEMDWELVRELAEEWRAAIEKDRPEALGDYGGQWEHDIAQQVMYTVYGDGWAR